MKKKLIFNINALIQLVGGDCGLSMEKNNMYITTSRCEGDQETMNGMET